MRKALRNGFRAKHKQNGSAIAGKQPKSGKTKIKLDERVLGANAARRELSQHLAIPMPANVFVFVFFVFFPSPE